MNLYTGWYNKVMLDKILLKHFNSFCDNTLLYEIFLLHWILYLWLKSET